MFECSNTGVVDIYIERCTGKRESCYACSVLLRSFHMHQVYQNICSNAQNDMGQKPRDGKMRIKYGTKEAFSFSWRHC